MRIFKSLNFTTRLKIEIPLTVQEETQVMFLPLKDLHWFEKTRSTEVVGFRNAYCRRHPWLQIRIG